MNKVNENISAKQYFSSGYYCAESVLLALSKKMGIESDLLLKMATPFCSGVSRTNGICGAVSGALMAIGLKYGRTSNRDSVEDSYKYAQEFIKLFNEKHGSTNCFELTGCDFTSTEGHEKFNNENKEEGCLNFVKDAEEIAWELIK
jgi:C_GCAxxG_C_C family probable redox protein